MKEDYSNLNVRECSEESSVEHRSVKMYCILQRKHSHTMDKCKNFKDLLNKYRKKKKSFKPYTQGKKRAKYSIQIDWERANALIEKNSKMYKEEEKEED